MTPSQSIASLIRRLITYTSLDVSSNNAERLDTKYATDYQHEMPDGCEEFTQYVKSPNDSPRLHRKGAGPPNQKEMHRQTLLHPTLAVNPAFTQSVASITSELMTGKLKYNEVVPEIPGDASSIVPR